MIQDTTGWNVLTNDQLADLGLDKIQGAIKADFPLNKKIGTTNVKQTVYSIANKITGNIETFEKPGGALTGAGQKIYSLAADTKQEVIHHQPTFDAFFTGDNARQLGNLNKSTKKAVLGFAKNDVNLNIPGTRETYKRIREAKGYKSLANMYEGTTEINNENIQAVKDGRQWPPGDFLSVLGPAGASISGGVGFVQGFMANERLQAKSFTTGGTQEVLRYPRQSLESFGYDYISIKAFQYVASGLKTAATSKGNKKTGFGSGGRFTQSFETIQLPMIPATETSSVGWGQDSLDSVKAGMADAASGAIQEIATLDVAGLGAKAGESVSMMKSLVADNPGTADAVKAYFAGQAIGQNVTARATGQIINPNMELLFSGPSLRNFNFNFTLTPRDPEEANICKRIIRAMKRNMSPQREGVGLFLKSPRVFQIEYMFGRDSSTPQLHPYLNKFKPCACKNFSVNYLPDGSYATYRDGSLTSYQITMSFGEIEPIYADEYPENENNMGY